MISTTAQKANSQRLNALMKVIQGPQDPLSLKLCHSTLLMGAARIRLPNLLTSFLTHHTISSHNGKKQ
ncbi:hypothetical protein EUGRSUZ_F02709 [Eucalyptus grandis]|uniref:Uncharacterized protein n=2 Tax=Eucalyptus grandis TaxID=71139 RepID=A0ACC3KIK0_EUCGR|nr:hypothetical protein EUGRSUZ_F02709 [Eucalyptus grandis]